MEHLNEKKIRDSSKNIYIKNIQRLNNNEEIKDLIFLKNTDTIMKKLEKYKDNSKRTYLISIVSTLKDQKGFEDCFKFYYNEMMTLNKNLKINNTKSESQQKNWITQDEVKETFNKLVEQAKPLFNLKKLNEEEYKRVLYMIVLGLYVLQPVRRNKDYQLMKIVPNMKAVSKTPNYKDFNYLDLSTNKFLFFNFKTSGTYHLQEVDINNELLQLIKIYLKFYPTKKKDFLLVDYQGKPFILVNDITRILNKIFKKSIGVSMLRNIFLTNEFGDEVQKMNSLAKDMGTSSNVVSNVYVKIEPKKN
jgi:hypothetical protein